MSICVDVVGGSIVPVSGQTETNCTAYLLQTATEFRNFNAAFSTDLMAFLGIDSATILYVFTWGMGAVLMSWSLGYVVGIAQDLIKKI